MPDFDFTLIFCTIGRTVEVANFFAALKRDTPADLTLQIILVDQNDDDRLSPIVNEYSKLWTIDYIKTDVRGISPARNLVVERIAGKIVSFPDDDCMYIDGTLQNVKNFFDQHPAEDVLVGIWSDSAKPVFSKAKFERRINRFSLFKRGEAFVQFYRRNVIQAVGNFDLDFGPGPSSLYPHGGDDSDYLLRASLAGFKLRRVARVHVTHPLQNTASFSHEKISGYGFSRMKLLRKHNMPTWFKLANLFYPVFQMILHPCSVKYYFAMFKGRFQGYS